VASLRLLGLAALPLAALAACSAGQSPSPASTGACPGAANLSDATAGAAADATADAAVGGDGGAPFNVLLFSRTAGFRHESIPTAIAQLKALQATGGYVAEATEDPTQFSTDNLARFQVVVFLLTTGDVLDDDQQAAFEAWIGAGGGYVGVHSAADTEYDWPFYGTLMGAYFLSHPAIQQASVDIEVADHPATIGLPSPWVRTDEWYNFQTNPRPNVTVLATVDESTYTGGTMGADHPITWSHPTGGGGRAFYTAMGHTDESYCDPLFRQMLVGALRWVAGR
jgi:type 1 glutamine amidotransferase